MHFNETPFPRLLVLVHVRNHSVTHTPILYSNLDCHTLSDLSLSQTRKLTPSTPSHPLVCGRNLWNP
jgi:hypothetical protein